MCAFSFEQRFKDLTGHQPLSWQSRLFRSHFENTDLSDCEVIDLPTGLGKTMVMAIWLIGTEVNRRLPRRLIYVVDRRTVVDQATDLATRLCDVYGKGKVEISTLRGQLADNRLWSRDPAKPAIIIGTVDLIGSALLFSGYRTSYRRRPLEAGLLGQDSLLLLDEAHLSKPFEKLITSISSFQAGQGSPMKVVCMSATTMGKGKSQFQLDETDCISTLLDLDGEPVNNPTVERLEASKRLTVTVLGDKDKLNDKLADAAIELATDPEAIGKRIVVFVRAPKDARAITDAIRKHGSVKARPGPYADVVEVLTGTIRGLERDELVDKDVFKDRWLNGDLSPQSSENQQPVFLISTSAGEVGFDLNADHMVCDAAPIDSMIQRLGRVNRRGKGNAIVKLFHQPPKQKLDKDGTSKQLDGVNLSVANTIELLTGVTDVSPRSIAALRSSALWEQAYAAACSPEPMMVNLTDILLDAWSMTSITSPMPGRPEVGPWLRGIADELPQTTIAWREELDVPGFDGVHLDEIEEWFDTHRVLTHETLTDRSDYVADILVRRWNKLNSDLPAADFERLRCAPVVIDRSGLQLMAVSTFMNLIENKSGKAVVDPIRNATLILPACFGGIERGKGFLDSDAPILDVADGSLSVSPDVADLRGRSRQIVAKTEDGDSEVRTIGRGAKPQPAARFVLEIEADDDTRIQLISFVPKREKLDFGLREQPLSEHVGLVRNHMDDMLSRLSLPVEIQNAACLAADFHDHGKNRERWQRMVQGVATPAGLPWSERTLGKSGGDVRRDPRRYRHEFGSLCEFIDAYAQGKLVADDGSPISVDVFDLAAHLIVTHHGRGRPHFPNGGFDPDGEERSSDVRTESIRRFARLQRRYGWWYLAWLENLLRCADAMASAAPVAAHDPMNGCTNATGGAI